MSGSEGRTTTKKELVNRIAEGTSLKKVAVKKVIQAFLDEIVRELAAGHRIEFREFGVFEVKERAPRRAQNPRTLEKVTVPSRRVVKFKVGRVMRERVCRDKPGRPRPEAAPPEPPQRKLPPAPLPPATSSNSPF